MELPGVLYFLEAHCPSFFSDIDELSQTLGTFSDSIVMLANSKSTREDDYVPSAASLAGRAVAAYNRHPAPTKFRQFSKPKIFEVIRKRNANNLRLQGLHHRLAIDSREVRAQSALGTNAAMVLDSLSYLRIIDPQAVGGTFDSMHRPTEGVSGAELSNWETNVPAVSLVCMKIQRNWFGGKLQLVGPARRSLGLLLGWLLGSLHCVFHESIHLQSDFLQICQISLLPQARAIIAHC